MVFLGLSIIGNSSIAQINTQFLGRYSIGTYNADGGVAEISAYDPGSKRMFVTNGPDNSLRIVSLANPASPSQISSISMAAYGSDITSVACNKKGIIAAAVLDSNGKTNPSSIVFLDINGNFISKVKVGANADHVIFTPNGNKVLVANEGEPNNGYTIDPEGSVSIIDVSGGFAGLTQSNVQTAGFTAFNAPAVIDSRIRIFGKIQSGGVFSRNSTVAEDLEPEYITISDDNNTAWVTCQENNCVAVININTATVTSLMPLGYKNHALLENAFDGSDRDGVSNAALAKIDTFPVLGMYLPDGISSYKVGSQTYFVTANEGDARADWGSANNEETSVGSGSYNLDPTKFGGAARVTALKANTGIGRLTVTKWFGDNNSDGLYDTIFAFGARSFSIWDGSTGSLVWDSKDEFERRTLAAYPSNFNASHSSNSLDNRSDNKGPEPESVTIGKILDSTYAFVALERIGGIMIYNITNPNSPYFVQYINTRNFAVTPSQANLATVGDLGPEGIVFIPRSESPNGKDLILLSNEVSGTVAVFQVNSRSAFQMQVLHASDMESGVDAPIDAPNFAAVLDTLENTYPNTVKLASGDCYIPSPFLSAGEDPSMQTPLRNTASSYYAGTTSGLRAAIGRTDVAMMNIMGFQGSAFGNHEFDLGTPEVNSIIGVDIRSNGADKRWIGAQFPYLSANLNFTNDINLSYLTTTQRLHVDSFKTPVNITANSQKKGIAPSAIIEMNGEKVGIVGATTQLLATISSPGATTVTSGGSDNMVALAAVLQPVIDSLRSLGINKVILMSHLQQLANEKALAPLLKGLDIIIAGGSHSLCADGNDRIRVGTTVADKYPILTVNNDNEPVAILNTTSEWKYVGRFVCDFDADGILLTNLLDSTINGAYAADTAMVTSLWGTYTAAFASGTKGANVRTLTSQIATVINNKDGNKFGKSNVFLEGRRNFVRTEETNFGNLTADANLWYAKLADSEVKVSIKNGGGIRSAIGNINAVGNSTILENTPANPSANKAKGDISQLDIENSLRFNNGLVIGRTNAAGLKRILEHGISATTTGATPGQFPQVGGVMFSYNVNLSAGNRIRSMVLVDSLGNRLDTIVKNGALVGDTSRIIKFVTLDFLFTGGDNYPFPTNATNRVNLDTAIKTTGIATFTTTGKEQDAFAEYMGNFYTSAAYNLRDTSINGDTRIQSLSNRLDAIIVPNAGANSSQSPYLTTIKSGVQFTSILTAGDRVGSYTMAGIPDGVGAFDNGNGTFTALINHEFGNTVGVNRAHGNKGAFVSKWIVNKSDLSVVSGSDLIQTAKLWNGSGYTTYNASSPMVSGFNRFCSADLPAVSAFYNSRTGLGTQSRIFMNGEESGSEGRAFAHIVTGPEAGTTYELPYLGKFSWENSVANPNVSNKTIVVGTDDATPGQVYVYVGTKTNSGNEIEKAGLSNGKLYGIAVNGLATEVSGSFPTAGTAFTMVDLGIVRDSSGAALNTKSNSLSVTNFLRPEDATWDPSNPKDLYFVTTNNITSPSRLWKVSFSNIENPELGGTITALLDGTEGPKMMDNIGIDKNGLLLIQEDVGNNVHNGKIWQYNTKNDQLTLLAQHDTTRFISGSANYLTQDEESSGIIDMEEILGPGQFILVDQAHYGVAGEIVEGGQFLSMFNPDSYKASLGILANSSQTPYLLPARSDVSFDAIITAGDSVGSYKMAGIPDGVGAFDNGNGTFTALINHEFGNTVGINRAHGNKGAFVSKWVINKADLSIVSGSDLIQKVRLWDNVAKRFVNYNSDTPMLSGFNRFCSADLPAVSAFFNSKTNKGTQERIFLNGEESGAEGRAFAHIATGVNAGTTYELPYLGKFSWENAVASPFAGDKTVVAGTDDATPGQVYFYVGTKTNTGTEIDRAGLNNGKLYGVAVAGLTTEISGTTPRDTTFTLVDLGIVRDSTGSSLNTRSNSLNVTNFLRPEDGAWDPKKPTDFYFVTTNSISAPSRLWRLRFKSASNVLTGGTISAVLNGTEGPKMMDNIGFDTLGHILIQEDVGNNIHIGKIWSYNVENDQLSLVAQHDSTRFITGAANYLTQDEESSGIIDMATILGKGKFLLVDQAHYAKSTEIVEGGQLLLMTIAETILDPITIAQDSVEIGVISNNSTLNIQANTLAGADKYDWVVPTGVNIVSGQGTKSLNIQFADPVKFLSPAAKAKYIYCTATNLLSNTTSAKDSIMISKNKPMFTIEALTTNQNKNLAKGTWTSVAAIGSSDRIVNVNSTTDLKVGSLVKVLSGTGNMGNSNSVDSILSSTQFRVANNMTTNVANGAVLVAYFVPQNTFDIYTSNAGATNLVNVITVSSTSGLKEGMLVDLASGTGTFRAGTVVSKIIDANNFIVSLTPSVALADNAVVKAYPFINNTCLISVNTGLSSEADITVVATPVHNLGYTFTLPRGSRISRIGDSLVANYDTTVNPLKAIKTTANSIGIVFDSSFTSGSIKVTPYNNAGNGIALSQTIKEEKASIFKVVSTGAAIKNTTVRYKASVTNGAEITTYRWTIPATNVTALSGSVSSNVVITTTDTLSLSFGNLFKSGSLKVEAINNCGTGTAKTFSLNGTTTLSKNGNNELEEVTEGILVNTLNVYPNPNNGTFNISYINNQIEENATVSIINMMGQTVRSFNFSNTDGLLSAEINHELESGFYFVKVEVGTQVEIVKISVEK
jgi:2',3'-cyclic-nucleotide 2'-phosphodiesterase / 3'-nucleotidase / 5'-nucleotidase